MPHVQQGIRRDYIMDYQALSDILDRAYDRAVNGKGAERHANGLPWEQQPILTIGREMGMGFGLGQAKKKISEVTSGTAPNPVGELLDCISYIASVIKLFDEGME